MAFFAGAVEEVPENTDVEKSQFFCCFFSRPELVLRELLEASTRRGLSEITESLNHPTCQT